MATLNGTPCQFPFTPQGEWNCEDEVVAMLTLILPARAGAIHLHSCAGHLKDAAATGTNLLVPNLN